MFERWPELCMKPRCATSTVFGVVVVPRAPGAVDCAAVGVRRVAGPVRVPGDVLAAHGDVAEDQPHHVQHAHVRAGRRETPRDGMAEVGPLGHVGGPPVQDEGAVRRTGPGEIPGERGEGGVDGEGCLPERRPIEVREPHQLVAVRIGRCRSGPARDGDQRGEDGDGRDRESDEAPRTRRVSRAGGNGGRRAVDGHRRDRAAPESAGQSPVRSGDVNEGPVRAGTGRGALADA